MKRKYRLGGLYVARTWDSYDEQIIFRVDSFCAMPHNGSAWQIKGKYIICTPIASEKDDWALNAWSFSLIRSHGVTTDTHVHKVKPITARDLPLYLHMPVKYSLFTGLLKDLL